MAYVKQNFETGQTLTADALNHMEDGISYDKELKILFIGNSLTQDAVSYLPLLFDEIAPEVKYTIYDWYNGGNTLAQQYSKFIANTPCENFGTITNKKDGGWDSQRNTITMKWVCENCDFDVVVIQEYSYYDFDDSTEVANFNNIVSYLREYHDKAFKVYSYIDAPMRTRITGDYDKAKKYAALHIKNSVSEGLVNPGTAVVYALEDSLLKNLGDKGQLSPDGTHTQEGLPCMIQSYVLALWLFDWLGIPKSIINSSTRMTAAFYSKWQSFGPNLGTGVVEGNEAQYKRAQEIAVKSYKYGKQLLADILSYFSDEKEDSGSSGGGSGDTGGGDNSGDSGGSGDTGGDSGSTTPDLPPLGLNVYKAGVIFNYSVSAGSTPTYTTNQYTEKYDIYSYVVGPDSKYLVTINSGLYDSRGNMPIIAVCDANGVAIDVIRTNTNTQTVHIEKHNIDVSEYPGASYILMCAFEDILDVQKDASVVEVDTTIDLSGGMLSNKNVVGSGYMTTSSPYTSTYTTYKAVPASKAICNLTVTHGLFSEAGTNMIVAVICDSTGVVQEIIRSSTNVPKERTETLVVNTTNYADGSFFIFTCITNKYEIVAYENSQ